MDKSLALAITKALAYTENGGKPNLKHPSKGKSGEAASIFQYTPDTWKAYSKEVFGKEVPLTPDTEVAVTTKKVDQWLSQGKKPEQIFSMWNAGQGEPDAYTGKFSDGSPSKGVNKKYSVPFDVPTYANKGMKYLKEFQPQISQQLGSKGASQGGQQRPQLPPEAQQLLKQNLAMLQGAQKTQNPALAQSQPGLLSPAAPTA